MNQNENQMNEPFISIVIPAYNEHGNIGKLHEAISKVFENLKHRFEFVVVDDNSEDETYDLISQLSQQHENVRGIRLSRNSGSHKAIMCGLQKCTGSCAIVMAADLQDPPETIPKLLAEWEVGQQIVWAVRGSDEGGKCIKPSSKLYYWMMRNIFSAKAMPATGADFFLLDRKVINALKEYRESNSSILGLLMWMGFRQKHITYTKRDRHAGTSGWCFRKKIKLLIDSITSFSYLPVRVMSVTGFIVSFLGFVYALVVIINSFFGHPIQGWSSLMIIILFVGGVQMLMMGILGEYLWRALDESRRRPLYLIEADTAETDTQRRCR